MIAVVEAPLHTTWSDGSFTLGVGFTVIVKVSVGPLQTTVPVNKGVTVMVEVTAKLPLLVAVNGAISPLPLAESPIEALSFVHV